MWYTCWFSLFAAVLFCKVTASLNEQILEHCSQGKCQVRFLWVSGPYIFINQSIHDLFTCVSACLIWMCCWFINSELMANSALTHAVCFISRCVFLPKAHHSPLLLQNTEQHFSARLRGHFKQQSHHKKHTDVGNVALNRLWKRHFSIVWELKQGGRRWPPKTWAGNRHIPRPNFLHPEGVRECPQKCHKDWFWS